MKWISANKPPDKDMLCIIACKREDGTIFIPGYKGYYTIGLQRTLTDTVYVGFMQPRVITWIPVPEPFTRNKSGWILTRERYPEKRGEYIVSTYDQRGHEKVELAFFESEKEIFYGQPDVIAWMLILKVKID